MTYPPAAVPLGTASQSAQQHHLEAARHLVLAATSHRDAALYHAYAKPVTAAQKAQAADTHVAAAAEHARQAINT